MSLTRTSAPSASSTTSRGSMPEYPPTREPPPAKRFGLRAARIATSTRSPFARRQTVEEALRVDNAEVVANADLADRAVDNRDRAHHADKVPSSDVLSGDVAAERQTNSPFRL